MNFDSRKRHRSCVTIISLGIALLAATGCQEVDTLKREILKKLSGQDPQKEESFHPRDGITIRATSLYQTANPNSEVTSSYLRKRPSTPGRQGGRILPCTHTRR
jgi:hypothetical protein